MQQTNCELLYAGSCKHPEFITMRGGSWSPIVFPSMFGLITHPTEGAILFDTGYSDFFRAESQKFPNKIYRWVTPIQLADSESAVSQCKAKGISADDVRWIVISHFHADHIAGLRSFPKAKFVCSRAAFLACSGVGLSYVRKGYISALIPNDFESRAVFIDNMPRVAIEHLGGFNTGIDIFGDQQLFAIDLPGHSAGHFGLLVRTGSEQVFLVGDACWSGRAAREQRLPSFITRLLFDDWKEYVRTFHNLKKVYLESPTIELVPSHCLEIFNKHHKRSAY